MCGRFTVVRNADAVAATFGVGQSTIEFGPRYNIAPSQAVAVVTGRSPDRAMEWMQWGLVPFWARDPEIGARLINARAETLAEKASFRHALVRRRCLVPADGFYEWKRDGPRKQPYHIRRRDGALFAFAGLWEEWQSPDGSPLRTCAIVTVEPNALMAGIHTRMPAILDNDDMDIWARPVGPGVTRPDDVTAAAYAVLRPCPSDWLDAVPVTPRVGSPAFDDPRCIEPLTAG